MTTTKNLSNSNSLMNMKKILIIIDQLNIKYIMYYYLKFKPICVVSVFSNLINRDRPKYLFSSKN